MSPGGWVDLEDRRLDNGDLAHFENRFAKLPELVCGTARSTGFCVAMSNTTGSLWMSWRCVDMG